MREEKGRCLKNLIRLWLLLWFELTLQEEENGAHEKGQNRSVTGTIRII